MEIVCRPETYRRFKSSSLRQIKRKKAQKTVIQYVFVPFFFLYKIFYPTVYLTYQKRVGK